jgi:hypothetical protein
MPATEIPRQDWPRFLEQFTQEHKAWLVTLERHGAGSGVLTEAQDLPLEGITVNLSEKGEAVSLILAKQDLPHGHLVHSIEAVTAIVLEESGTKSDKFLRIRSAAGRDTVIRFRRVIVPGHPPPHADSQSKSGPVT